jgi:DNA-directed RNA polymerase specialized sigma54-like protein
MSAFDSVLKLAKQWQPDALPTELKYRDSLIAHLREQLREAKIEPEYRHLGTTTDIYVKHSGFLGSSEVFVELKRNFLQKAQCDRLIGQIESLEPKKNSIIVVSAERRIQRY